MCIIPNITRLLALTFLLSCKQIDTTVKKEGNNEKTFILAINELDSLKRLAGEQPHFYKPIKSDSTTVAEFKEEIDFYKDARDYYSNRLKQIGEPDIATDIDSNSTVYRLNWTRAFDPDVILIRISNKNDTINLTTKILSSVIRDTSIGLRDSIVLLKTEHKALTLKDWIEFERLIKNSYFWDIKGDSWRGVGYDGSWWTLEAATNSTDKKNFPRYHIVIRWSPHDNSYREACEHLIKLTGQDFGKIY